MKIESETRRHHQQNVSHNMPSPSLILLRKSSVSRSLFFVTGPLKTKAHRFTFCLIGLNHIWPLLITDI